MTGVKPHLFLHGLQILLSQVFVLRVICTLCDHNDIEDEFHFTLNVKFTQI